MAPDLEDIKKPLRDGDKDRKGDPVYAGHWFLNANSSTKPGCVDADRNPILDSSELYLNTSSQSARCGFMAGIIPENRLTFNVCSRFHQTFYLAMTYASYVQDRLAIQYPRKKEIVQEVSMVAEETPVF